MAKTTAQLYSPAEVIMIDLDDNRLEVAKRFGATAAINSADGKAPETIIKMTGERGVDTAIEAVGIPATFELCENRQGSDVNSGMCQRSASGTEEKWCAVSRPILNVHSRLGQTPKKYEALIEYQGRYLALIVAVEKNAIPEKAGTPAELLICADRPGSSSISAACRPFNSQYARMRWRWASRPSRRRPGPRR